MNELNYLKLDKIIDDYKNNFEEHRKQELYKWKAIKSFQDNWNIDDKDFADMLKRALKASSNLLNSGRYFPYKMITDFAEFEAETTRQMFEILFDEDRDFYQRYDIFVNMSKALADKYFPGKHHYQDAHAISTYLTFRYPDKYFLFKYSIDNKIASYLDINIHTKDKAIELMSYFEFANEVLEYIKNDKELLALSQSSLGKEHYSDDKFHVLTWDLLFYGGRTINTHSLSKNKLDMYLLPLNGSKALDKYFEQFEHEIQYFWITANPKIWSFSDINIGEVVEYTSENENGNKRRIYKNFLDARAGDLVIAYESTPIKAAVALCEIAESLDSGILKIKKIENLVNTVPYKEIMNLEGMENSEFSQNSNGTFFKLTKQEYNSIFDLIREYNPKVKTRNEKYDKSDFLTDVFIPETQYNKMVSLLRRKKNIILKGAPGVGKTFMAKRLAYSMMGEKDNKRINIIQFHQSYSYEDFIEGFRPNEITYNIEKGIFYHFCKLAENDKNNDYFFIIDEINRGNLSKIFGELLMLIENDKRNEKINLLYSNVPFHVPDNIYIIGMMNTADRSLAMIDYALRRRFAFCSILPAFESKQFKEYQSSLNSDKFNKLIDVIKKLNEDIDNDPSLGAGFKIGHSYFCNLENANDNELSSIVEYEILPLIEEYWFDDVDKYNIWADKLNGVING